MSFDLQYEPDTSPDRPNLVGPRVLAGEITVMGAIAECDPLVDPKRRTPLLVFRFGVDPSTGREIPAVVLALTADRLEVVGELVAAAATHALDVYRSSP